MADTQELTELLKGSYKRNEHNRLERLAMSIYCLPGLLESTNDNISVPLGDFHRAVNKLVRFTAIDGSNINNMLKVCIPRLDGMITSTDGNLFVNALRMRELSLKQFVGMVVTRPPRKKAVSNKVRKQPKLTSESQESKKSADVDSPHEMFNDSIAYIIGSLCKLKTETEIPIQFEISADVDRRIIHVNF